MNNTEQANAITISSNQYNKRDYFLKQLHKSFLATVTSIVMSVKRAMMPFIYSYNY